MSRDSKSNKFTEQIKTISATQEHRSTSCNLWTPSFLWQSRTSFPWSSSAKSTGAVASPSLRSAASGMPSWWAEAIKSSRSSTSWNAMLPHILDWKACSTMEVFTPDSTALALQLYTIRLAVLLSFAENAQTWIKNKITTFLTNHLWSGAAGTPRVPSQWGPG